MAVTKAVQTGDFSGFIRPELAEAYFEEVRKVSVVQSLARQVPLSANGVDVPIVTSKPTAGWVSEGGQKPTTNGGLGIKTMTPKKLAAIVPVSAEVVRSNPGGFMEILKQDIAEAFAKAFDAAALHGTDSPFGSDQNLAATSKTVTLGTATAAKGGLFADINEGLNVLAKDRKRLTGFALDTVVEPMLNSSVDNNGRPIFTASPTTGTAESVVAGTLLGRPAVFAEGIAPATTTGSVVGFGGNWSKCIWGTVGGITFDVSTEAAVTIGGKLVSLFENNLVAVRAEAEFGWLLADKENFVKYTLK
jgi:HK97 family phage major capsid protein|nr:MAG TPA: major capsid protein [Caudoviricetes sp.]